MMMLIIFIIIVTLIANVIAIQMLNEIQIDILLIKLIKMLIMKENNDIQK